MEKLLGLSGMDPSACLGRPGHPIRHAGSTSNMFNWSQTWLKKISGEMMREIVAFHFFSHH